MSTTIRSASGTIRRLPDQLDPRRVAGLDEAGRIVVDDFDARNAEARKVGGYMSYPFMFGLTLCCDASDKGVEDGVVCRGCYGTAPNADEGNYLFRWPDAGLVGLDPVVEFRTDMPFTADLEGLAVEHGVSVKRFPKSVSLRVGSADATVALIAVLCGAAATPAVV